MAKTPFSHDVIQQAYFAPRWDRSVTKQAITTSAAASVGPLDRGLYVLRGNVDFHMRQGASGLTAATTSNARIFDAEREYPVKVEDDGGSAGADTYLSILAATSNDNVWLVRID